MKIKTKQIRVKNVKIGGGGPIILIAGPCVIEDDKSTFEIAASIKEVSCKYNTPFIFKASFDKANRSSVKSYRGPGIVKGLKVLSNIKKKLDIPITSDVHCLADIERAKKVLDIIQIPAFLSRQTDLIVAAARTGKIVNVKKGQFLAPRDIKNIIDKIKSTGNRKILITERGTTFGYNNLVTDMRSLYIIQKLGYPVIYDATHSVQLPGGAGTSSAGQREFVLPLSRAAVAFGCDGLFLEVHKNPAKALCDGPNSINISTLGKLLKQIRQIREIII